MIDVIKQKIADSKSNEEKINKTREFLQLLALKIMFDRKHFGNLAFVGGTALRVLFDLKRFSEDLDFSLVHPKGYVFKSLINDLKNDLNLYGLSVEATLKDKKTVNSCMIKFPGILKDLGLSGFKDQKLSIKIEVDSNPPKGWGLALTPVTSSFVFAVSHFDLPSLFATKIHACYFRRYSKGRDFYDLIWYFGKKIKPNYKLLNNAIAQTEHGHKELDKDNIRDFMKEKVKHLDFPALRKDIERFLEDKNELNMIEKDILAGIIDSAGWL